MVKCIYSGRLGNKLFIYCFGRIVAEALSLNLEAEGIEGFENTFEKVTGDTFDSPKLVISGCDRVDIDELIRKKYKGNITIEGWVQLSEYYEKHEEKIKQWLKTPKSSVLLKKNDAVIPIRCGDFFQAGRVLSQEYYDMVLRQNSFENIWITSDEPDHQYVRDISDKYGAKIYRGSMAEQFSFIRDASNIILCLSTFSWWAAFLSDARVFFPVLKNPHWYWCNEKEIDLRVNKSNYINISGVKVLGESSVRSESEMICVCINTYNECGNQLSECFKRVKKNIPDSKVHVFIGGKRREHAEIAKSFGFEYSVVENLGNNENWHLWWKRMLEWFLGTPGSVLFKIDPDTMVDQKPIGIPNDDFFGYVYEDFVQGGCICISRSAAELIDREKLLDPGENREWIYPGRINTKFSTFAEDRFFAAMLRSVNIHPKHWSETCCLYQCPVENNPIGFSIVHPRYYSKES